MKKIFLFIGLLLFCCLVIVYYANMRKKNVQIITKPSDLIKTEKINIKNSNKIIKVINNKTKIDNIVNEIVAGTRIQSDENIVYIGATYILEMLDKHNNILETINFYTPQGGQQFIKLNNLDEFYYLDINKVLEICNLEIN